MTLAFSGEVLVLSERLSPAWSSPSTWFRASSFPKNPGRLTQSYDARLAITPSQESPLRPEVFEASSGLFGGGCLSLWPVV